MPCSLLPIHLIEQAIARIKDGLIMPPLCKSLFPEINSEQTGKPFVFERRYCPNCRSGIMTFSEREGMWLPCTSCGEEIDMEQLIGQASISVKVSYW